MFSLGIAMGNLLGGIAVENWGITAMLILAACFACVGTVLINVTVGRRDVTA